MSQREALSEFGSSILDTRRDEKNSLFSFQILFTYYPQRREEYSEVLERSLESFTGVRKDLDS